MRKIKFRQFANGQIYYWGVALGDSTFSGPVSGGAVRTDRTPHDQFTGMHDKNGDEIYEGDIISLHYGVPPTKDVLSVFWCESELTWLTKRHKKAFNPGYKLRQLDTAEGCYIIGNIHQTPELLEKK